MNITDIWQMIINPQIWPLFLTFLGGYIMMNIFFGHDKIKKGFTELERILIALGIGLLFEFFIFLPAVGLANYWHPFLEGNANMPAAALFCAVSVSALFYKIYGEPREKFIKATKKILLRLIVLSSFFVVLVLGIGISTIFEYPTYVASLISGPWGSFMQLTLVSWFMFMAGVFFLIVYVLKLSFKQSFKQKLGVLFRRRAFVGAVAISIIVVITSLLIVPADTQLNIFTPRMTTGPETFSSNMRTDGGYFKCIFIKATRGSGNNVSAAYQYYALLSTTYNITLPALKFIPILNLFSFSSVYINNPSNTSFSVGEYSPSFPSATEDWKRIYITAPSNTTCQSIVEETSTFESKVVGLTFSFANSTENRSASVTLDYWQEIDPIDNVRIDYDNLTFADLGNGTWTETHTILVTNNSNDTLIIPAMQYDRFNFGYVIRNSTRVYLNGNLLPYAELIWPTRLSFFVWASPQTTSNITVTFQMTVNPENVS